MRIAPPAVNHRSVAASSQNEHYLVLLCDKRDGDRYITFGKSTLGHIARIIETDTNVHLAVTTSADAESYFSMYNHLLTSLHTHLAVEALHMLEFLCWNFNA